MSSTPPIVCRPTPWFRYRAGIIFLMFLVFAVLFFIDGSSGYRKKNQVYYLHQTFKQASQHFSEMNAEQDLDKDAWLAFAKSQNVAFPDDTSILPADVELPHPWPEILHDYEQMKSLQWNRLWLDYTKEKGMDSTAPEKIYDARTIREQWVFFVICSLLSVVSLFFLIRTSRRKIEATAGHLISQDGRQVAYADFKQLDLRKWDNKGIAIAHFENQGGRGKIRIDGLTYGGFKKEQGQPAEQLMKRLRENFSGEILEYTSVGEAAEIEESPPSAPKN